MSEEGWIILRCAGRSTLPLVASLLEDGYHAWTPMESRRAPRTKAERAIPVMPTFVFARAGRLLDLIERSELPNGNFSVFHYFDKIPLIADAELDALRRYEAKAAPRESWPSFSPAEDVTATDGPYCGLGGKVVRSRGEWAVVMFGWQRVKISTFILKPIMANSGLSAAKAA